LTRSLPLRLIQAGHAKDPSKSRIGDRSNEWMQAELENKPRWYQSRETDKKGIWGGC